MFVYVVGVSKIYDAQCAFQLRAVPGIPWHQHRSSLALQPVDCPGWPFGSVVDLLCTIKAGQNMDVHMRSARLQDLPGISPMFVVVHCSAIYIYILTTRRFDACFRAIPGSFMYRHVLRASTSARRTGLLRCRTMCTNGRPVVAMLLTLTLQHSESLCWYQWPWFKTRIKIPKQNRNHAWSLDGDLSSEPPHDRL